MKLDFEPKSNITAFDNVAMQLKKMRSRINDFLVVRSIVRNWQYVFLFRVGIKKAGFAMQLQSGKNIQINKPEDYFSFWETKEAQEELLKQSNLDETIKIAENDRALKFKFENKIVKLIYDSQKQMNNTLGMIKGQFIEEQYKWLKVEGKDVIDIGANIGDSAIYFALKGAKHVYAFEPYPYSYNIANKNVRLNGLQNKITLFNQGCGRKETTIKVDSSYENFGGTDLKAFKSGKEMKITTLNEIIKKFNIEYPAILKIDCEGCEYGVLLKANDSDLRKFEQIQIEYHYGYLNLKRKLKNAGFNIHIRHPMEFMNTEADNHKMFLGFIYAIKN
jgi:FkbM family methyltransferase